MATLNSIECSDQPLDISFHPENETIVAAALVDGTLEVHDFASVLAKADQKMAAKKEEEEEEEEDDDTILSSTLIHTQKIRQNNPSKNSGATVDHRDRKPASRRTEYKKASCRAVHFSAFNHERLFTGGSAGDLVCIDATRVCVFSSETKSSILWHIEAASTGTSLYNPIHVLYQLPESCSKGGLIVTGDDQGGVRLWDERLCDAAYNNNNNPPTDPAAPPPRAAAAAAAANPNNNNPQSALQLPQGCVLSWKEHKDYISAVTHSEDGNTLLATSADGCLSVFDIRKSSTSNILQNSQYVTKSDPQDDELLSLTTMKHGKKVVAGTQDGVVAIWSWGTWGDISDRYPTICPSGISMDAILKVDEDTILTGTSDGIIRVATIHPNKVLGTLDDHSSEFPIEALAFTANRKYVGSISHDPYIRLWDAKNLMEEDDEDDEEDEDNHRKRPATRGTSASAAAAAAAAAANRGGQASDDEWDDMDEKDAEEEEEEKEDDDDEKDSDDSDDDSDDDEGRPTRSDTRAKKLKTKSEEFFADL